MFFLGPLNQTCILFFRLYSAEELCSFERSATRTEDSPKAVVAESTEFGTITSKVVSTVKEFFWKFEASWELLLVRGAGESPEDVLRVGGRKGAHEIKTATENPPKPLGSKV